MATGLPAKCCCQCAKKPTRNRIINPHTKVCNECAGGDENEPPQREAAAVEIDDNATLGETRFRDLKEWLQNELHTSIKQIVKEELKTELAEIRKNVSDLKGETKKNHDLAQGNSSRIDKLDTDMQQVKRQSIDDSTISKNNLKYLINLDRNERRQNIIFFGVPESDLTLNDEVIKTDLSKCNALLQVMGVREICSNAIREIFRLGKLDDGDTEKRRPLKVKFLSSVPASAVLGAKEKLKDIHGENIYVNPDKTKGEQEEFQRIGKRKNDLLAEYGNDKERVKLDKGVLFIDGVEVDRYKSVQTLF